jgi:hypothetical protein
VTRCQVVLNGDGTARMPGVETGDLRVVASYADVVVLKEAGRKRWAGRFTDRVYEPGQYRVLRLLDFHSETTRPRRWWAEEVVRFPVRA